MHIGLKFCAVSLSTSGSKAQLAESSHSKPETLEALGSSPGQAIMSKTVFTETLKKKKKSKKKSVKPTYRP